MRFKLEIALQGDSRLRRMDNGATLEFGDEGDCHLVSTEGSFFQTPGHWKLTRVELDPLASDNREIRYTLEG
jgi:hypothetical protein